MSYAVQNVKLLVKGVAVALFSGHVGQFIAVGFHLYTVAHDYALP